MAGAVFKAMDGIENAINVTVAEYWFSIVCASELGMAQ